MSERRNGNTPKSGAGAAVSGLSQPFYNLGYAIGDSIGKAIFGDPAAEARKKAEEAQRAEGEAQEAAIRRQWAEDQARIRAAEEARKRQETFDRLSSQLQLSTDFDGRGTGPVLMLGDNDGFRPQGTPFFAAGGGAAPSGTPDTLSLIMGDPNVVDLRDKKDPSYAVDLTVVKGADPQLKQELLGDFSGTIQKRTDQPNQQAQSIMRSIKTGEPPNPMKDLRDLAPGDVILVAPVKVKNNLMDEDAHHVKEVLESNAIMWLDRWGSGNWSSPASHAAIFLGSRNGKNWYLDNTSVGPVIKEEKEFLKEYGQRKMDIATLVGRPLSQHEGEELWKGAHELRNTTTYWPSKVPNPGSDDAGMVCSEASRWLLMRAGRYVPEAQNPDRQVLGVTLNKKEFVAFSPSDFYEEQGQYFLIHPLGMPGEPGE